jgi:sterol desaturase/sphingolipid hydroxylase (fatty acid hydroxylase superfamily)
MFGWPLTTLILTWCYVLWLECHRRKKVGHNSSTTTTTTTTITIDKPTQKQIIENVLINQSTQFIASVFLVWVEHTQSEYYGTDLDQISATLIVSNYAEWTVLLIFETVRFLGSMICLDLWQYVLHRLLHTSYQFYHKIHAKHHEIRTNPIAYGAFYQTLLEAIVLDGFGFVVASTVMGLSPNQSGFLGLLASLKTTHDHACLHDQMTWRTDPFILWKYISRNSHGYHWKHHIPGFSQTHFEQPFFAFFDEIFHTDK